LTPDKFFSDRIYGNDGPPIFIVWISRQKITEELESMSKEQGFMLHSRLPIILQKSGRAGISERNGNEYHKSYTRSQK